MAERARVPREEVEDMRTQDLKKPGSRAHTERRDDLDGTIWQETCHFPALCVLEISAIARKDS
jgi:hypothetical protein